MTTNEKKRNFVYMMNVAGKTYHRDVDAELVAIYIELLNGFDLDEAAQAISFLLRTSKFFPAPSEIITVLEGDTETVALRSFNQFAEALKDLRTARINCDNFTNAVVQSLGGWSQYRGFTYDRIDFERRRFIQTAKIMHRDRQFQHQLEHSTIKIQKPITESNGFAKLGANLRLNLD